MTPPTFRQDATPPRRYPRGIRFQLSSLLLLSTLNAVALAAAVIFLFVTLADRVGRQHVAIQEGTVLITEVHDALITEGDRAVAVESRLDGALEILSTLPVDLQGVRPALAQYKIEAARWQALVARRRPPDPTPQADGALGETPPPASAPTLDLTALTLADGEAQARLKALTLTHRLTLGEIALLSERGRPPWISQVLPWGRWFMAWIFLMALVTILMAVRIRTVLSDPLEALTHDTAMVAQGRMDRAIPALAPWRGAPEILALSRSIEAMRVRLIKSIEASEDRAQELTGVLNSLDEGVLVLDRQGVIRELNARALSAVADRQSEGRPPREGRGLREIFPSLRADLPEVGVTHALTFPVKVGRPRHLSLRLHHLKGGRTRDRFAIAVIRDVTHAFEVEELKRDFLSVVTHELKTPLTAIEGYAKLLAMGKGGDLSARQQGFADVILQQTGVLKEMIQTLLDITRLEGGSLPLERERIDAGEALGDAAAAMAGEAEGKGIALVVDAPELQGRQVDADPFRLAQLLGNLIGNALKFTEPGGEVRLLGGVLPPRGDGDPPGEGAPAQDSRPRLWMAVEDTGRGIPTEALPHLFEKFFQVAKADTRNRGGAGLGLYICHLLAQAHGGDLTVTSTLGVGSRFTLTLPQPTPHGDPRGAPEELRDG